MRTIINIFMWMLSCVGFATFVLLLYLKIGKPLEFTHYEVLYTYLTAPFIVHILLESATKNKKQENNLDEEPFHDTI